MSRPPRFSYAQAVHHVTLRCNNREFLFDESSFGLFFEILQRGRGEFPISLYNYCLMTNHVHLLFKVGTEGTLSKFMHWLSTSFTRRFNKAAGRNGHLWEGRFRSTVIEEASYFFRSMAYVDLNPVRAEMAALPADYRWSAHRAICEEDAEVVAPHPLYLESGRDRAARASAYCAMLAEEAGRPPVSLARVYFVGRPHFVVRMAKRFGLNRPDVLVLREPLGSGLFALGPRPGKGTGAPK